MSFLREIAPWTEQPQCVSLVDRPEALRKIHRPVCAAALWRRAPLPSFQAWLNGLAPEQLPKARLVLHPEKVRDAIATLTERHGMPNVPERQVLSDDAAALATIFAEVMQTPYLRVRMDVITGNACRKFHIDAVTARLVCTYRGTGTQYGIAPNGAEPAQMSTVPTGSPIILRGTLWPETPSSALRHRSTPIEGTGETRLVLVLDPVAGLDDDMEDAHPRLH